MPQLDRNNFQNVLIVKPSSLGDVVRCLPVLSGLRRHFNQGHIAWLARPDCAALLECTSGLDEIIHFDRKRYGKIAYNPAAAREFINFLRHIRSKRFDLILDLQGLFRSGFISYCSGASVRLGFANAREFAQHFYTHRIAVGTQPEHIVDSYWRFATALGFGHLNKRFEFNPDSTDSDVLQSLLSPDYNSTMQIAVLLIGGAHAVKRWPTDSFAQLAAQLHQRYNLTAVLLGAGDQEAQLAQQLATQATTPVVDLVNRTNMQQLKTIINNAKLVIGNDSGPLHVAAALARPVVGLYGPTDPTVVGPYGPRAAVVQAGAQYPRLGRYSRRPEHQMTNITLEQVLTTIDQLDW